MTAKIEKISLTQLLATADGPSDAVCQSKSCQLSHNCTNKLCNRSNVYITDPQQLNVRKVTDINKSM